MEGQKTALVTGAASGIGAAIAERFLSAGYQVAFFDIVGQAARATASRISFGARKVGSEPFSHWVKGHLGRKTFLRKGKTYPLVRGGENHPFRVWRRQVDRPKLLYMKTMKPGLCVDGSSYARTFGGSWHNDRIYPPNPSEASPSS
jgi:short chain dehydrogenase